MRHTEAGPTPRTLAVNGTAPADPAASPKPESHSSRTNGDNGASAPRGNGNGRRHLLRRGHRLPLEAEDEGIRLRRRRRVSAPFTAVPGLARQKTEGER